MKRLLSALIVLSVVGSALAFKTKEQANIFRCVNKVCVASIYSTEKAFPEQLPSNPGFPTYTGTIGTCDTNPLTDDCLPTNDPVYDNE